MTITVRLSQKSTEILENNKTKTIEQNIQESSTIMNRNMPKIKKNYMLIIHDSAKVFEILVNLVTY